MASQPHPVDVYVGSRVRLRRTLLGMSQQKLAEAPPVGYRHDPLVGRETLELVRAYYKITDPSVRKRLFDLTKSLAEISDQDAGNPKRRRPRKSC